MRIAVLIVIMNSNPCGIFEKMTSVTQIFNQDLEQEKLLVAVKFPEIEVQKTCVLMFVMD